MRRRISAVKLPTPGPYSTMTGSEHLRVLQNVAGEEHQLIAESRIPVHQLPLP
jgi:hypothetical protein